MIDCPICHVRNEDDARFCSECGQRLTPSVATTPPPISPNTQGAPEVSGPIPVQQGKPPAQRLHSPLLANAAESNPSGPFGQAEPPVDAANEVNRLRQMASRQQPDKPASFQQDLPFKNPFDPRNDPRSTPPVGQNAEPQPQGAPAEAPAHQSRGRLRSPLLAGDDFDENEEEYQPTTPQTQRGGGLHSPLLGGGGASGNQRNSRPGSNSSHNNNAYPDDGYDSEPSSGTGLRSPLLGGGGGYSGDSDRRRESPTNYPGQERRGGLRSPMLGGGSANSDEYYQDEYFEEEAIDEDNPNVLRSPLLAAKRPLDRPSTRPQGSNPAQNAQRSDQPVDPRYRQGNQQSPNSSYNNLKSINSQVASGAVPPVPPPQQQSPQQQHPPQLPQTQLQPPQLSSQLPQTQSQPPQLQQPPTPPPIAPVFTAPGTPSDAPAGYATTPAGYQYGLENPSPSATAQNLQSPVPPGNTRPPLPNHQAPDLHAPWPQTGTPVPLGSSTSGPTASADRQPNTATGASGTMADSQPQIHAPSPTGSPSYAAGSDTGAKSGLDARNYDEPQAARPTRGKPRILSSAIQSEEDTQYEPHPPAGRSFSPTASEEPPSPIPKIVGGLATVLLLVEIGAFMGLMGDPGWSKIPWFVSHYLVVMGTLVCLMVFGFTSKR